MKKLTAHMLLAFAPLAAAPAFAAGPGFDCAKATRQIDKSICAWETIGLLDGQMADAYRTALMAQDGEAALAAAKASQKAWLSERDTRCGLDSVTPLEGSVDGLSPKEYGQFMCLQTIYPERLAQLMDMSVTPLVPFDVKMVPIEPLKAAYPDDWRQPDYEAQLSPDKSLMALGIKDDAGYVMHVWLYEPASGRLVVASPRTHEGKIEKPEDIAALNVWLWGDDGSFYVRTDQPLGEDRLFAADMNGYAEVKDPPADIQEGLAAYDAASGSMPYNSERPKTERLPGFDDDSYNEQKGGAFTAWDQNRGHGSFDLLAARAGDTQPRLIASGGSELEDFQFDPSGTRLFYNGGDGLLVADPETGATRRLKGTRGMSLEVRPIQMSADGEILVYWAVSSCTHDAADPIDPNEGDDTARRVCLAYLPPADRPAPKDPAGAVAAPADPWVGEWSGGYLSATIRRGTAKRDYLVIDLVTGLEGCAGAVTLYGKPSGAKVLGESYDPNDPSAPLCRVELSRDGMGVLTTEEAGPCNYYHGTSCGFEGSMTHGE